MRREWIWAAAGGAAIGAVAVALWRLGNPPNMGFCTACFVPDAAGALGLLSAENSNIFGLRSSASSSGRFSSRSCGASSSRAPAPRP
jgi:hypothetical protein